MTELNGLIQHSFALRLADGHWPFDGGTTKANLSGRFNVPAPNGGWFRVEQLKFGVDRNAPAMHTLLAGPDLTTVVPVPLSGLADPTNRVGGKLPQALSWAGPGKIDAAAGSCCGDRSMRPRMSFAESKQKHKPPSRNDFLVVGANGTEELGKEVAHSLLEAVAFRRSQLFGLAIANRFVNVMLPCATLIPREGGDNAGESLLLLALVSLMRAGGDRSAFRRMYSLTLYAIPVTPESEARKMDLCEIQSIVNAGWGLAEAVPQEALPRYVFSGPLRDYVEGLVRPGEEALLNRARRKGPLSFRMVTELIAYAVALGMAQGSRGQALATTKRHIGNDVVTSLGTARVTAATLVDPKLDPWHVDKPVERRDPPGSLTPLMRTLAPEARAPNVWTKGIRRQYQLDRPFVDSNNHAVAILPANRCLLVTYVRKEKRASPVPLLSLVAGVTFMTVGTATAIGTLRSIDRDLERLEHEDPLKIAEIDGEVATDLHEIYDLDISNETYRSLYRRLCRRLGITRDYRTLQDKMQTLYRATSTLHDDREQKQLARLTAAIVVLSVLILIGTIVVALKPG